MEVIYGHFVLRDLVAELIRLAIREARLQAVAREEDRKRVLMMIAARLADALRERRAAEFRAPDEKRILQQATAFQIGEQAGDWFIEACRLLAVIFNDVLVRIPVDSRRAERPAVPQLNEANALLQQPPSEQTIAAEALGDFLVHPVKAHSFPQSRCRG